MTDITPSLKKYSRDEDDVREVKDWIPEESEFVCLPIPDEG